MTPAERPVPAGPLVVLDVDSTLIENEVIELLADCAGSGVEVARITSQAMAGELDFEQSLRARVATLAGLSVECFREVGERIQLTTGAAELVDTVHAAGGHVGVVSGGFHELVDPIANKLGLDFWRANRLEVKEGLLTGEVLGDVIDAQAKASALREWAEQTGTPRIFTVAVGDGANDLLMMDEAGLSVAFDAKPIVREHADVSVPVRDLREILSLLGLRG